MKNKTTWLQFCRYDEHDNCIVKKFEIPTDWLENEIEEPLEQFMDEYTSDESIPIYHSAILQEKILTEKIE